MPVVFIFSAMVSGIAAVMLLYMAVTKLRKLTIDVHCVDSIAMYLFYIFIIDFQPGDVGPCSPNLRGG